MNPSSSFNRREFIAGTSALLLTSNFVNADESSAPTSSPPEKLAIEGGAKAIKKAPQKPKRWGDPELAQFTEMLKQDSLIYWKAPQTTLLVKRFQEHVPLQHVMNCSSGTAALHIAVATAGLGPGDEVITSGFTDIGTVIGILFQQAVPVFADLEPHTYQISARTVAPLITSKTKAIIAVHLGGNPSELSELKALADRSCFGIDDLRQLDHRIVGSAVRSGIPDEPLSFLHVGKPGAVDQVRSHFFGSAAIENEFDHGVIRTDLVAPEGQ